MDGSWIAPETVLGGIELSFANRLLRHEEIDSANAEALLVRIVRAGHWKQPLLIEAKSSVILDGHHRFWVAAQLGLLCVPIVRVAYDDPNLTLESWRIEWPVTPDDVLEAARTGKLLPKKTSRHRLKTGLPDCAVPLEQLRWRLAA